MTDIETIATISKRVRAQEPTESLGAKIAKLRAEVDEAIKNHGAHCDE